MQVSPLKQKSMINDLTIGNVPSQLVRFALPFVLANILQYLYNIVDMIIVGRYVGAGGLSAVSIGGEFMHFFMFIAVGFAQAGTVVLAQTVGAGERDRLSKVIGNMFSFILSISILATLVSVLFAAQYNKLMNTPPESLQEALDYCRVCGFGMFFVFGYNIVSYIMRGLGDSKRPLYFVAVSAVMNLILDLVFVAGMHMRAKGAALATVIGQAFSFIVSIIYLYRRKEAFGFDFKPQSFKPDKKILGTIVRLGIPVCLQNTAVSVSMMYVNSCINVYGVIYSAVTGLSGKISQLCNVFTMSLNAAAATMIGQNFGAGKHDRVSRVFWCDLLISSVFAVILSVLLVLFPEPLFRLFNDEPAVLAVAMEAIPIIILNFFGTASRSPSGALINGIGYAGMNFFMGIMDGIVIRIGLALLFGQVLKLGVHGYWYGSSIAGFAFFLVIFPYFLSGRWKNRNKVI